MRYIVGALIFPVAAMGDPALECVDAGSQVDIGDCVRVMEMRVNTAIDSAYALARDAARELDEVTGRDSMLPALTAAHAAWVAYRDAQCEAVGASFGGGSGTGIAITACRVDLGRARVDELLGHAD